MNFSELAEKRYSCRKFSDQKVDGALLDKIVETAIKAPTAVNRQAYKIFRFDSEQAKEKLRSVTRFSFGADAFLAVGYKAQDAWVRKFDGMNFAAVDASIVATHIMMEICDLGLGTTWVGHFDAPRLKELCPEMEGYEMIAIFPIGYAAEDDVPSERHFERKAKEEILEVL